MTYDDHEYHDDGCGKHSSTCWCGDVARNEQCRCLTGRAGMAVAYRKVADRLAENDPTLYVHCGIPLEETGQCRHRDHHATPFHPTVERGVVTLPELPEKPEMAR